MGYRRDAVLRCVLLRTMTERSRFPPRCCFGKSPKAARKTGRKKLRLWASGRRMEQPRWSMRRLNGKPGFVSARPTSPLTAILICRFPTHTLGPMRPIKPPAKSTPPFWGTSTLAIRMEPRSAPTTATLRSTGTFGLIRSTLNWDENLRLATRCHCDHSSV